MTTLLHHREGLTIEELSSRLAISRNAVNQHLASLGESGFTQSTLLESTGGRPSRVYTLTPSGLELFQRQYALLAKLLLAWTNQHMGEQALESCLTDLGQQMASEYESRLAKHASQAGKLREVAAILSELGYDAHVVQTPEQRLEIIANNCVFQALAQQCEGFCTLDLSFLAALLKAKIEHKECIVRNGNRCCFRIADSAN
ncbi:HTH domain-containing protein [Nitrosomonas halophila]|uniref:helix-turn-helix transcriptional regulator n=1 Tax=Nitrosomonas halophila TaxID=44576 RepID=UPI001FDFAEF1